MTKSGGDPTQSASPSIVDHLARIDDAASDAADYPDASAKPFQSGAALHDGEDVSTAAPRYGDHMAQQHARQALQEVANGGIGPTVADASVTVDGEPSADLSGVVAVGESANDEGTAALKVANFHEQNRPDAAPSNGAGNKRTRHKHTGHKHTGPKQVAHDQRQGHGQHESRQKFGPVADKPSQQKQQADGKSYRYAALDLGTNNCRLLIAEPSENGFRIVDSFSRIVRLGEGITANNRLSDDASSRAIEALRVCWNKLVFHGIERSRLIATEACRSAENGPAFLERVRSEVGLDLEIIDRETEARLAVTGCVSLIDPRADGVVLFDIGGGSSEVVWMDRRGRRKRNALGGTLRSWDSLPLGVVTLSERHDGRHVTRDSFEAMVAEVQGHLARFPRRDELMKALERGRHHLLGTSGTVTTLAGIQLGLRRYDRRKVDGLWMSDADAARMIDALLAMDYDARVAHPCIGADRADLVLPGCAIFEAIRRDFNCSRLRVADRGLREGILVELMGRDGHKVRRGGRKGKRSRRRGQVNPGAASGERAIHGKGSS